MIRNNAFSISRLLVPAALVASLVVSGSVIQADSLAQDPQRRPRAEQRTTTAAPPVSRNCDMDFMPDQYNDRIDCKTENVNVALYDYIDTVISFDKMRREMGRDPIFTDSQMDQMLAGRERAQAAKNRSHEAKSFRGAVKKQKAEDADCFTKELIGDGKGDDEQPCEMGEDCEEVSGDGIGNDDGKCKLKGKNREVCVQVCQQPLVGDMDNFDPDQAFDTEQGLVELDEALVEATAETKRAMDRMQSAYSNRLAEDAADDCGMFEFDLFPGAVALQVAQVVKNATGATFNGCSVVCNQDAFGWNCEAACLVFAIIDGIANAINDALAIADGNNGSAQLDRVARCTTQLNTEVTGISASVDGNAAALDGVEEQLDEVAVQLSALTAQVEALSAMMGQRFDTVDGFLCVPQGQRECFPGGALGATGAPESISSGRTERSPQLRRP